MSRDTRNNALKILKGPVGHTPLQVHNAIVDLRRNPEDGDEILLRKYLDFKDDMVVSATLFALIHIYKPIPDLFEIEFRFADGDSRDNGEMPIQTQAIEGLALRSHEIPKAMSKLMSLAQDIATPEAPRSRAWQCLAGLFGVAWERDFTEAMIWDPDSEKSESIRATVLAAIEEQAR